EGAVLDRFDPLLETSVEGCLEVKDADAGAGDRLALEVEEAAADGHVVPRQTDQQVVFDRPGLLGTPDPYDRAETARLLPARPDAGRRDEQLAVVARRREREATVLVGLGPDLRRCIVLRALPRDVPLEQVHLGPGHRFAVRVEGATADALVLGG